MAPNAALPNIFDIVRTAHRTALAKCVFGIVVNELKNRRLEQAKRGDGDPFAYAALNRLAALTRQRIVAVRGQNRPRQKVAQVRDDTAAFDRRIEEVVL